MTDLPIVIRGARDASDVLCAGRAVEHLAEIAPGQQSYIRIGDRLCAITIMRTQVRVDMSEWVGHD